MLFLSCFYSSIIHYIFYFAIYILHFVKNIFDKQKKPGFPGFIRYFFSFVKNGCRIYDSPHPNPAPSMIVKTNQVMVARSGDTITRLT